MKKQKVYYIKWLDAQSEDSWLLYNHKGDIENMIIESIGFYIDETKDYIRLALSRGHNESGSNEQFCGTMSIPKRTIVKKKRIR